MFIILFVGSSIINDNIDSLLRPHIQNLINVDIYRIPGVSQTSVQSSVQFLLRHLQMRGLINDGNVCGLLCFILVCHRMRLESYFVDLPRISRNNTPDFPVLMFLRMLKALPSPGPFSIQLFVQSWNNSTTLQNGRAALGVNDDILVVDNVMRSFVAYFRTRNTPVITRFTMKYNCNVCGIPYSNISLDDNVGFSCVPLLDIPDCRGISPGQLLTNLLNTPINMNCVACNTRVQATLVPERGTYTLFAINRLQYDRQNPNVVLPKVMTKLTDRRSTGAGERLCGDLISCISHIGSHQQGHWVSYHKTTDNVWWKNNDSYPIVQSNHPFNVNHNNETVNFVVYKNE